MKKVIIYAATWIMLILVGAVYAQEKVREVKGIGWTNPIDNEDSSVLTDLAKVNIYQSTTSGVYASENLVVSVPTTEPGIDVEHIFDVPLQGIDGEVVYFVATAEDDVGNESNYSEEISVVYDLTAPNPPTLRFVRAGNEIALIFEGISASIAKIDLSVE